MSIESIEKRGIYLNIAREIGTRASRVTKMAETLDFVIRNGELAKGDINNVYTKLQESLDKLNKTFARLPKAEKMRKVINADMKGDQA